MVSLGRIDLARMREAGDRRAALIRGLKAQTPKLLATILIGQNLFVSSASALATALATNWLGENRRRADRDPVFDDRPLRVRRNDAQGDRRRLSRVDLSRRGGPRHLDDESSFADRDGLRSADDEGASTRRHQGADAAAHRGRDARSVINLGADEGLIHGEERRRLHKVLEFGDKTVRDICVPRTKVVALPDTARFADLKLVLREHKLSRLPIYRGTLDNIDRHPSREGPLRSDRRTGEGQFRIADYIDPPFLVPEFKPARGALSRNGPPAPAHGHRRWTSSAEPPESSRSKTRSKPFSGRSRTSSTRKRGPVSLPRASGATCSTAALRLDQLQEQFRDRAAARGSRDDRRPSDAAVRTHPAKGRSLEGTPRRFRSRGSDSDRDQEGVDDIAGKEVRTGDQATGDE